VISLDTNIVVRLFVDTDRKQTEAAQRCLEDNDHVAIADIALIEATYVLTQYYGKNRQASSECIEALLANAKVNCNRPLFHRALKLYQEHPALSIEDCCLVSYAKLNGDTPLMTFDKKLAKQTHYSELLA
jgi:predicted nucleic-acid-binding protein